MKRIIILLFLFISNICSAQVPVHIMQKVLAASKAKQSISTPTAELIGWWTFNYPAGYYRDDSTNGIGIFPYGPLQSNITYSAGTSAPYYDGVDDYMQSWDTFPTEWTTNNGQTVSIWFKPDITTNFRTGGVGGAGLFHMYQPYVAADNYILYSGVDTVDKFCFSDYFHANVLSTNQWTTNWCNWISCVKTGRVVFWIDGVQKFNGAYTAGAPSNSCFTYLGQRISYGFTKGHIGRLDAWALGFDDTTASNLFFNQTYPTNPVMSVKFREGIITNTIKDLIGTNDFITQFTAQGAAGSVTVRNGYEPRWKADGSYEFGAHGNNVLTNNINVNLGTNFTISFWANPTTTTNTWQYIPISFWSGATARAGVNLGGTYADASGTNHSISLFLASGARAETLCGTWTNTDTNVWTHLCFVVSAGTNVSIYKNGTNMATLRQNFTALAGSITKIMLGTGSSWPYKGSLDDLRIYSGVLTSNDVFNLSTNRF